MVVILISNIARCAGSLTDYLQHPPARRLELFVSHGQLRDIPCPSSHFKPEKNTAGRGIRTREHRLRGEQDVSATAAE